MAGKKKAENPKTDVFERKKDNIRAVNRFRGYYVEDINCTLCLHYRNKKTGCGYAVCLYEDERRDAEAHGRIMRKRRFDTWDD